MRRSLNVSTYRGSRCRTIEFEWKAKQLRSILLLAVRQAFDSKALVFLKGFSKFRLYEEKMQKNRNQ